MAACSKNWIRGGLVAVLIATGIVVDLAPARIALEPRSAHARVGRPLTPVSYAGVARRTSRRTARRTTARMNTYSTLPADCVSSGGVYRCGSASYRPAYSGADVVYVPY